MPTIAIGPTPLALADIRTALAGRFAVRPEPEVETAVASGHAAIAALLTGGEPIYGVNTGFGKLAKARIAEADLARLQVNLVRSHAAGTGEPLKPETVRLVLLLKARSLAQGYSGISPATLAAEVPTAVRVPGRR